MLQANPGLQETRIGSRRNCLALFYWGWFQKCKGAPGTTGLWWWRHAKSESFFVGDFSFIFLKTKKDKVAFDKFFGESGYCYCRKDWKWRNNSKSGSFHGRYCPWWFIRSISRYWTWFGTMGSRGTCFQNWRRASCWLYSTCLHYKFTFTIKQSSNWLSTNLPPNFISFMYWIVLYFYYSQT